MTFESWCDRDHFIAFDFDPDIVAIAAQPFRFEFTTSDGVRRPHVPDYFLRNADGCGVVVDIKPDKLIDAKIRVNFAATATLCRQTGWA